MDQGAGGELFTHWLLRHLRMLGSTFRPAFDAVRRVPSPAPPRVRMEARLGGLGAVRGIGAEPGRGRHDTLGVPDAGRETPAAGLTPGR